MTLSPRYPPVQGRLHTRYAPVRRSPARYCYRLLPLDLHVLSLPLAFILSQDQTLHCKNCSFYLLDSSPYPPPYLNRTGDTRYLFFSSVSNNCRFPVENGCKDTTFFHTDKIFFQKKLHRKAITPVNHRDKNQTFFRHLLPRGPQAAPPAAEITGIAAPWGPKTAKTAKNHCILL